MPEKGVRLPTRIIRTVCLGTHVLQGLGRVRPYHPDPRYIRKWCWGFFRHLNIRVEHQGCLPDPSRGPYLVVSNHVSWLDPVGISSVHPVRFVSKSEIGQWPLLGPLSRRGGAVFLERGSPRSLKGVSQEMETLFCQGESIGLFPEGTTTRGSGVLPFAPALFEPACRTKASVLPVAIRYTRNNGTELAMSAAFVDNQSFLSSFKSILQEGDLQITLSWTPPIRPGEMPRRHLAELSQNRIEDILKSGKMPETDATFLLP